MKIDPSGEALVVRLYRDDVLATSFRRPMPSVLEFLLDVGTGLAR